MPAKYVRPWEFVERFLAAWPNAGQNKKAYLLVHHWLDALACWSLEDLYLLPPELAELGPLGAGGTGGNRLDRHYFRSL
jgi:hypothetical protein